MKWICGLMIVLAMVTMAQTAVAQTAVAKTAVLTWTANVEPDLAGYKVYRGNGVCAIGPLAPLMVNGVAVSVGRSAVTYTDMTVPVFDGALCYELTAYDTAGNESGRSVRATRQVNLIPPLAPAGLTVVVQ